MSEYEWTHPGLASTAFLFAALGRGVSKEWALIGANEFSKRVAGSTITWQTMDAAADAMLDLLDEVGDGGDTESAGQR